VDFRELVDAFLDERAYLRGLTPKTVRAYRIALHQFESYWANLDSADKPFEDAVERAVMTKMKAGVKRVSAASYLNAVSAFGNWLHAKGYRAAPYVKPRVRYDRKMPQFLTHDEIVAILETPVESLNLRRAQVAARLFLDTGIRSAELLALEPEDLGEHFVLVHGKGSKDRYVPWLSNTRDVVLQFVADFPGKFVFHTNTGRKMGDRNLLRDVKELAKRAGIGKWEDDKFIPKRVYLHLLRHSCATHYLRGGGNIKVLSGMLGHSSISVTNRYAGVDDQIMLADHLKASPLARLGPHVDLQGATSGGNRVSNTAPQTKIA
jgi:site-specific recombinase XerD